MWLAALDLWLLLVLIICASLLLVVLFELRIADHAVWVVVHMLLAVCEDSIEATACLWIVSLVYVWALNSGVSRACWA